jgi:hypothetical protein
MENADWRSWRPDDGWPPLRWLPRLMLENIKRRVRFALLRHRAAKVRRWREAMPEEEVRRRVAESMEYERIAEDNGLVEEARRERQHQYWLLRGWRRL